MLSKVLAAAFIVLILGKMFFRPQLRVLGRWFDGVINAFLIAIALAYAVQLFLWLSR